MKRPVSLVLSSGGARGIAHIGAIEELERQGFEIKSIAGTSMGSLIGGIYASGNLHDFKNRISKLDKKEVFNLVDFTLTSNGLVKGTKVIKELNKIIANINIENLPIPFTAVATDIRNKKEVVFEKGSLLKAIRASISIPTIFIPFKEDDMILIDGGVLNPLPINHIKRNKDDLLIAVDVNAPTPLSEENDDGKERTGSLQPMAKDEQLNYYTLLYVSAMLMMQKISAMSVEMYKPDIVIRIPMNSYGLLHFHKANEIINAGVLAAQIALSEFQSGKNI